MVECDEVEDECEGIIEVDEWWDDLDDECDFEWDDEWCSERIEIKWVEIFKNLDLILDDSLEHLIQSECLEKCNDECLDSLDSLDEKWRCEADEGDEMVEACDEEMEIMN